MTETQKTNTIPLSPNKQTCNQQSSDTPDTEQQLFLTLAMISLGCPKNLVESESLLAKLTQLGFILTSNYEYAHVIIVNTCGFLQSAKQEAADIISQLSLLKFPNGQCQSLIVIGCWPQLDAKNIIKKFPKVDAAIGVNNTDDIIDTIIDSLTKSKNKIALASRRVKPLPDESERFRLTPRHWCYLRISEGCSQQCSFCTIPKIRGKYRSKPIKQIIAEAKTMIDDGTKEIILIGQETTNYGYDINLNDGLAKLLKNLNKLNGLDWIRLMYTYPANFSDATIDAIANLDKLVKYVDIPLQHINDKILKLMTRKTDRKSIERLLEKLRAKIPNIAIRTTMIVGFPGETDKEFNELIEFVRNFEFDALGAFAFSPEPGTKAATLPNQVPEKIKQQRLDKLMSLQKKIAFKKAKSYINKTLSVYLEPTPTRRKYIQARHSKQAPEVDPITLIPKINLPEKYATPGTKLSVKCIATRGYDLIATPTKPVKPIQLQ